MSQHFPNFTESSPRNGQPAPVQTVRTSYVITSNDYNNGYAFVPVAFDAAFSDANYTVHVTLELPNANNVPTAYNLAFVQNHSKTAAGFTMGVTINKSVVGSGGDSIILHVVALHD